MRYLWPGIAVMIALWALVSCWPARAQAQMADLALVLAVDASGSVDYREFRLQLSGIAQAFRDAEVHEAIQRGANGRIAVALVVWAEAAAPKDWSGWQIVDLSRTAERFAAMAEGYPRQVAGGTGIGRAIQFAARLFDRAAPPHLRRVIDISGDGRETTFRDFGVPPGQARAYALARGVTINGLAILNDDPDLGTYYRDHVIAGPEAFAMEAADYEDFARAIKRKLLREIEHDPLVGHLQEGVRRPRLLAEISPEP